MSYLAFDDVESLTDESNVSPSCHHLFCCVSRQQLRQGRDEWNLILTCGFSGPPALTHSMKAQHSRVVQYVARWHNNRQAVLSRPFCSRGGLNAQWFATTNSCPRRERGRQRERDGTTEYRSFSLRRRGYCVVMCCISRLCHVHVLCNEQEKHVDCLVTDFRRGFSHLIMHHSSHERRDKKKKQRVQHEK